MRKPRYVVTIAVVALALCSVAAPQVYAQNSINEHFTSGVLPTELEATGGVGVTCCGDQVGGPVFENGVVRFAGQDTQGDWSGFLRTYLRTVQSDYQSVDFIAEVTVTVPNYGNVARNIVFFGFGRGDTDHSPGSGVPNFDGMFLQVSPGSFFPGLSVQDGTSASWIHNSPGLQCGGYGTFRLRIKWTAATRQAVISVQPNYSGGPFVANPSCVFPAVAGGDNGFDATNSRPYFGGDWNAVFDDFVVTSGQVNGFYPPVSMTQPTIAKAGSTLPLRWEIFDGAAPGPRGPSVPAVMSNEITDTAMVTSLTYTNTTAPCSTTPAPPSGDPVSLQSTGNTALRYDSAAGQFVYNWVVPKITGCYSVTMTTPISTMTANVDVTK